MISKKTPTFAGVFSLRAKKSLRCESSGCCVRVKSCDHNEGW